jgi:glycosyltransferase involved in cell wall biosynthesis/SAM-dependent methyltransferase
VTLTWAFHIDSVPFDAAVINGEASLGGSESACLGLARALVARGHRVHCFTTRLSEDAPKVDAWGVRWHPSHDLPNLCQWIDWDVFVALRIPNVFDLNVPAKLRLLWNQDMLVGDGAKLATMARAYAYDGVVYVSEYHRKQWEGLCPELKPLGWVTKNGFDPAHVPADVAKIPNRIIHISRPERGLVPLLTMWPELKKRVPDAELHIARYKSMYDGEGSNVKAMCENFDRMTAQVQAEVGGITFLGPLGKADLYRAIAESAVMWYPGIATFAETSCIAAIEAQACGTPFVGSYKGALPETIGAGAGWLVRGDAMSLEYQERSVTIVAGLLMEAEILPEGDDLRMVTKDYRRAQANGREHVQGYTYAAIAAEWETYVLDTFQRRVDTQGPQILAQLLHEDDHVAAQKLACEMGDTATVQFCQRVINGELLTAVDYATHAMDPRHEIASSNRIPAVVDRFAGCTRILDVACGNGAFAIAMALTDETRHVVGIDYAEGNIDVARKAAAEAGVADRCTFLMGAAYDFTTHDTHPDLEQALALGPFDGVFAGEFCEHTADLGWLMSVHRAVTAGGRVVLTMPAGPFVELAPKDSPLQKGHVHHFRPIDLTAVFGTQGDVVVDYLEQGVSVRGSAIGHWIVQYTPNGQPLGERPLAQRIFTTRPRMALSVGMIVNDVTDLRRCFDTIWPIADEIVIGDTGAGAKLDEFAAYRKVRIVPVGQVHTLRGGFAEARNTVLRACTGAWFLWIDADEVLVGIQNLQKYLEGGAFTGYALKQNHLMLDNPLTFDTPVRVFRRQDDIQFYGCIHEQPQQGDCNGDITPALQLEDVKIAHTGYLHEGIRRSKALQRNLPLLVRDQQEFPDRRLGKLLVLRDYTNLAMWEREGMGGAMTPKARTYYGQAIGLFEAEFFDPNDKYHALARPFYEQALQMLNGAIEVEVGMACGVQGLNGHRAKAERFWVRKPEHIAPVLEFRQRKLLEAFQQPPVDVEPWTAPQHAEVA